jgi:uncharacterized membrane protein (Fun14 family)
MRYISKYLNLIFFLGACALLGCYAEEFIHRVIQVVVGVFYLTLCIIVNCDLVRKERDARRASEVTENSKMT